MPGEDGIQGNQGNFLTGSPKIVELVLDLIRGEQGRNAGYDAPGPQGPDNGDDILRNVRQVNPHHIAFFKTIFNQHVGKLVGAFVQFTKGHIHPQVTHGGFIGHFLESLFNQFDVSGFKLLWLEIFETLIPIFLPESISIHRQVPPLLITS